MSNPLVEQIAKIVHAAAFGTNPRDTRGWDCVVHRPWLDVARSIIAVIRDAPVFSEEPAKMVVVDAIARMEFASERLMQAYAQHQQSEDGELKSLLLNEAVSMAREAAMLKRELNDPSRTEPISAFYSDYWKGKHDQSSAQSSTRDQGAPEATR